MIKASAATDSLLKGVVLALKVVEKPVRSEIAKETRGTMNPVWREAIATHAAGNRMDYIVFGKGARVAAGNPARLMSTTSRRALRKGDNPFIPNTMGRMLEFPPGADLKPTTYRRKSKHGTHDVTRHTMRGLPARRKGGRVVYPAVAEVAPRMVSMWVQIVVRNIHKALEER